MAYCAQCGTDVPAGAAACPKCGRPAPGAATSAAAAKRSNRTVIFVLAGCAAVFVRIALVGILAALIIPNFLDALNKAKQKRAVAELRSIGMAVESYKADHGFAPRVTDVNGLAQALGPDHRPAISKLDPWKHPFE